MQTNNPQIETLRAELQAAWSAETSSDASAWSTENPAWGQCAVTACVVQDELGGDILWAEAKLPDGRAISHYFNEVDGRGYDFTKGQFPEGTVVPAGAEKRKSFASTRDYVLSFEVTRQRYELLKRQREQARQKMAAVVREVVALNRYARRASYLSEPWASTDFKRTFAAAVKLSRQDNPTTMGVNVRWSDSQPELVVVTRSSIISERTEVLLQYPVCGELADALLADLQALAEVKARQDILDERERALRDQAAERVRALRQQAASQ